MPRPTLIPVTPAPRARILAAAGELLRRHPYDVFSMEAVARAATLSRRTLYNQFEDRTALYRAVWLEALQAAEAWLPIDFPRHAPPATALEQLIDQALALLGSDAHRDLKAALARDGDVAWLGTLYRDRILQPVFWAIERWLLTQGYQGRFVVRDPVVTARSLLALLDTAAATPSSFTGSEIARIFLDRLQAERAAIAAGPPHVCSAA